MYHDLDRIKRLIAEMESDFPKFYQQKNQSAGLRIRRHMQQIRELAQQVRLDVLAKSKRRAGTTRKSRSST
jgi:hypothetical protein